MLESENNDVGHPYENVEKAIQNRGRDLVDSFVQAITDADMVLKAECV